MNWEYAHLQFSAGLPEHWALSVNGHVRKELGTDTDAALNMLGAEGWELVLAIDVFNFYLKRPIR